MFITTHIQLIAKMIISKIIIVHNFKINMDYDIKTFHQMIFYLLFYDLSYINY